MRTLVPFLLSVAIISLCVIMVCVHRLTKSYEAIISLQKETISVQDHFIESLQQSYESEIAKNSENYQFEIDRLQSLLKDSNEVNNHLMMSFRKLFEEHENLKKEKS